VDPEVLADAFPALYVNFSSYFRQDPRSRVPTQP
jgi:Mlc titration factor MtfA (ptsG expression regulator)